MQANSPSPVLSIIVAIVGFILSFFASCNSPDANTNVVPTQFVDNKTVEIVFSAPRDGLTETNVIATKSVLEKRFSYLEAEVEVLPDNRFLLRLPSSVLEIQNEVIELATRPGVLRFRIVKDEFSEQEKFDLDMLEPSPFDKNIVVDASAGIDDYNGMAVVHFRISGYQQDKFGDFTEQNISKKLAVVLDSEVLIAPTLQARIASSAVITAIESLSQAEEIARIINSGELPFELNFDEIRIKTE